MKIIIMIIIGASIVFLGIGGLARHERHECIVWADQAEVYDEWRATDWQVEQCLYYNIEL